jgi:Kef-type K+ transport system membrane component KefB
MAARKASTVRPAPRHLLDIFSPRNQLNEPVTAPENRDSPALDRSFPSSAVPFTFEELVAFCGILLIFWVVGKSVEKFGLPALVGEILAGIAVGPHGMNIAPKPDALMMVGEFGLVLMVLEAGVEVDLASLSLVGARGVKVAFFGSLVPLAIGATLAKLVFDMSAKTCLAVGACLAPTSMGISLKVLQDGGVLGTPTGQLIIAAAVMDDVIALVLLSQLEALKDPTVVNFLVPIASSLAFIVLVGYLATRVVPDVLVKQVVPRVPKKHLEGVLLGAVFVAAYGMMVATHYGKSSHLLGAFLGGLCFCSLSSMQHVWHAQVEKILSWLIRVFFACTIGFEVPIRDLWTAPVLARAAVFMLAAFGKVATGLFARPFNAHEAAKIGFAMSAWGEFAFIVATASREAGTLGKQEFSAVILCVLLSAMYAPLAVNSAIKAEKRAAGLGKDGKRSLALVESGRSRWLCCGPKVLNRHVSFTTLAMPDGKQTAVYRVYYVCAIECPSRWGLNDAVLRAVYHPSVNLDVLDVSLEPRGNDAMACELFLRDPSLRAPLDAELDCEENRRVTAKLVSLKRALEKLVLASAARRQEKRRREGRDGERRCSVGERRRGAHRAMGARHRAADREPGRERRRRRLVRRRARRVLRAQAGAGPAAHRRDRGGGVHGPRSRRRFSGRRRKKRERRAFRLGSRLAPVHAGPAHPPRERHPAPPTGPPRHRRAARAQEPPLLPHGEPREPHTRGRRSAGRARPGFARAAGGSEAGVRRGARAGGREVGRARHGRRAPDRQRATRARRAGGGQETQRGRTVAAGPNQRGPRKEPRAQKRRVLAASRSTARTRTRTS